VTRIASNIAGSGRGARVFYAFGRAILVGSLTMWNRVTVHGKEHIPATGAFILAPVHRSNLDTPYAAATTRRRLRFMGKDSLWKVRPAGWLLSALGGFPVTRGSADREALKRCLDLLRAGEPLVLFPEGERKSGPLVHPLFDGPAYLASKANVPIVPVGIGGSERAMPKGARWIKPAKVHVVVGPALPPPAHDGQRATRAELRAVSDQLHEAVQTLFDEAQVLAGGV
jgi:1-acyl-sn-glycerol-3-phosphate acyltransferase